MDTNEWITPAKKHTIRAPRPIQPFRLLDLPPELRNKIYTLAVTKPRPIGFVSNQRYPQNGIRSIGVGERQPALARSCKQLRQEVLPIYFTENLWDVETLLLAMDKCDQAKARGIDFIDGVKKFAIRMPVTMLHTTFTDPGLTGIDKKGWYCTHQLTRLRELLDHSCICAVYIHVESHAQINDGRKHAAPVPPEVIAPLKQLFTRAWDERMDGGQLEELLFEQLKANKDVWREAALAHTGETPDRELIRLGV